MCSNRSYEIISHQSSFGWTSRHLGTLQSVLPNADRVCKIGTGEEYLRLLCLICVIGISRVVVPALSSHNVQLISALLIGESSSASAIHYLRTKERLASAVEGRDPEPVVSGTISATLLLNGALVIRHFLIGLLIA